MIELLIIAGLVYVAYKVGIINYIYDKLKLIITFLFKHLKWFKTNYSDYERGKSDIMKFKRLKRRELRANNEF